MTMRMTARQRDERMLRALKLLDLGFTQDQVAARLGMTRGPISRLVIEIRADMEKEARS
ncbi:hypothetical protein [Thalassococcus sp. S3]|uniref:hypothetical protein n=1 Tax=Thalassococcus sp. S3 TaxID=2017482 RepID=UPI0013EE5D5C|nr:hypothetical protein [Thalassococcus sp. S3]